MIGELARQIGATLGEASGVLVIDPSGVLKQGKASVGVARQWCGRAGKVDNCQVGVYLGYVSRKEHALSNAPFDTPLREFARVLGAEHRIEECLRRSKSDAGLAQYQVRTWEGWHHHQTLALLATWFLTQEKRRGEKGGALLIGPTATNHPGATAA
jgi:SRSO17 transposase